MLVEEEGNKYEHDAGKCWDEVTADRGMMRGDVGWMLDGSANGNAAANAVVLLQQRRVSGLAI